jgi:hypothetical protein
LTFQIQQTSHLGGELPRHETHIADTERGEFLELAHLGRQRGGKDSLAQRHVLEANQSSHLRGNGATKQIVIQAY